MKTFTYNEAGKLSVKQTGKPLAHEDWIDEQDRQQADDLRQMRATAGGQEAVESADELNALTVVDLKAKADSLGVESTSGMNKAELVRAIRKAERDAAK